MRPRRADTGTNVGFVRISASMFEQRNLRHDLAALSLLAFVVFSSLALFTYDRADLVVQPVAPFDRLYQPDVLVHPPNETTKNVCGRWGAMAADAMLTALGFGAYYLLISLAVLDVAMLRRRAIGVPVVRLFGWLVSLVGITSLSSLVLPNISPGPMIDSLASNNT